MKKFIVLMSHEISKIQKEDAYKNLGVKEIIQAPSYIKSIWANINPTSDLDTSILEDIIFWIKNIAEKNDYILIQGEFGATFYVVDYCFKNNLIPIYATSRRCVEEIIEGDKVVTNRVFVHEGYRKYVRYEK